MPLPQDKNCLLLVFGQELLDCVQGPSVGQPFTMADDSPPNHFIHEPPTGLHALHTLHTERMASNPLPHPDQRGEVHHSAIPGEPEPGRVYLVVLVHQG